jgi:hypothetical protein
MIGPAGKACERASAIRIANPGTWGMLLQAGVRDDGHAGFPVHGLDAPSGWLAVPRAYCCDGALDRGVSYHGRPKASLLRCTDVGLGE